ncbi:MAG: ABC transporter permease [Bacteroides sp.]|nr:ABC transporter permease [Bacteroides sp.]
MILHYIITAWRCIWKYKTQNLISVLGLSVALFCFSICLYITRYLYSTNDCFANKSRMVQLTTQNPVTGEVQGVTFCNFIDDIKKFPISGVETYVYVNHVEERPFNIEVAEEKVLPYTLQVMETDSAYLRVFTPEVLYGSWKQAAHAANSVLLSESMAKRIFGNAAEAVGKQMVLTRRLHTSPESTPRTGGIAYTIQGVMKDLPPNNSLHFLNRTDAWVLNDSEGILNSHMKRSVMSGLTYALLKEGVSPEKFCHELNERKLEIETFREKEYIVGLPFKDFFWNAPTAKYMAIITLIAGVLMLLVGMLNFFHFLIGSFVTRIREYSLRRVSGARAWQLWVMLFIQSALLILMSGWLTMIMMELTAPFLTIDLEGQIVLVIHHTIMMWQAGGYLLGLLVCCMIAAAIVIWKVQRISIQRGLFGGGGVYGKHRVRNVLLGVQLFICWIFVSLTLMLYLQSQKSANTLLNTLSIEEKENIYSIPMMEYTFLSQEERMNLIAELGKVPGVKALLPSDEGYISGVSLTSIFTQPGRSRDHIKETTIMSVVPAFYEFMNIPILSGVIPKNDNEMVVSKGFEEMMEKEMLGQMLYDWTETGRMVTAVCQPVIKSFHKLPEEFKQEVCVFQPLQEEYIYHCYVKCEPGQKKRVGKGLGEVLRKHLPENIDIQLKTMMDDVQENQALTFELRGIVGFFSIVSLLIVLLGVYAAITLDTEYRRKEMAIRKVNGAGVKDIAFIFARLYIWLLVITAIFAFPIVMFVIQSYSSLYAVFANTGIGFYVSIFVGITLVIALTVGFRIYLITKVNPAEIIRKE